MSYFDKAIDVIINHETYKKANGTVVYWVNNPNDPGGETAWGIAMRFVKEEKITPGELGLQNFDPGCMKKLTVDAAKKIYKKYFWDRGGYDRLTNERVATKIFDCTVNCGMKQCHKLVQRAANDIGQQLIDDGVLGPKSIAVINSCDPDAWLTAMVQRMKTYYTLIAARNTKLQVFMKGWFKRAAWIG